MDYVEDVASDLSVFHRVDDWQSMPGPLYFARAVRLHVYEGCMRARVEEVAQRGQAPTSASRPANAQPAKVSEETWLAQHSDWIDTN